jgi:hypothetical protein
MSHKTADQLKLLSAAQSLGASEAICSGQSRSSADACRCPKQRCEEHTAEWVPRVSRANAAAKLRQRQR